MIQILPTPRTPRELFELFAIYDRGNSISSLLNRVDWSALDRAGVLTMMFGTVGATRLAQPAGPDYAPRRHVRVLLHSNEFRERARKLVLDAFPEKRRMFFVHVPKCAGSDLAGMLRRLYPSLMQADFREGTEPELMFQILHDFVLGLRYADAVLLSGHETLAWYQANLLIRPGDWAFTTVRDPVAIMYSHVCYVLSVCRGAPRTGHPDGLGWLAALGVDQIADDASQADMAELGRRVLYHPRIPLLNPICTLLGDGTAEGALRRMAEADIEVTDTARYSDWRRARFPGSVETRANASLPYFTPDVATAADRDYIAERVAEDRKVFDLIAAALARSGKDSIRGRELSG